MAPKRNLNLVSILVDDYDKAIAWYTEKTGFKLKEDKPLTPGKRWVVVGPEEGCSLLLARAATPLQESRIGAQTGGRVFLFLHTDDFNRDYEHYREKGIEFIESPRHESYGRVAVFRDLYGNLWDLIEPAEE